MLSAYEGKLDSPSKHSLGAVINGARLFIGPAKLFKMFLCFDDCRLAPKMTIHNAPSSYNSCFPVLPIGQLSKSIVEKITRQEENMNENEMKHIVTH